MDTCENNADVYNKMIEPLQVLRQWSEAHKQEVLDAQDVYDTTTWRQNIYEEGLSSAR